MRHYYTFPEPFELELGGKIENLTIAYDTYGTLAEGGGNAVWVCHALTANSDVADWWPHTVEQGAFLDPEKCFTVCANIIGSCYGTTGPLSVNPTTGKPYYGDFPRLTIRDMARAHSLLADHLGLRRIHALVGSSVGGFQAVEWIAAEPRRFGRLVLIATDVKASPWSIAIDETQRMAIKADATWGKPTAEAGAAGLAAARAIGLLSYRGGEGYNLTQQDPESDTLPDDHRACTYQRHQGDKLVKRFNAYSYMTILDAFDTHDVGRGRGGVDAALRRICCPTMVVGLTTDIIFTPAEQREIARRIPGAVYREISSPLGHDGFLVEHGQLNAILNDFLH
ncbi:MAG TPA: homoserine O-acetyltransferase [Porphyromonadaceae bacterium]|nr:homoserine O-acetyltransferase [Paramuribaculum sp.]HAB41892.1 homoserine O-acetyltransferase [Porphyromonadaceae bacterium]